MRALLSPWMDLELYVVAASQQHTHKCRKNKYLQAKAHSGALINSPKNYFKNTFLGDVPLKDEEAFSKSKIHLPLGKICSSHSKHSNTIEKLCSVML